MPEGIVTQLTNAFKIDSLVSTFVSMAPFILGVAGAVLAVGLVKWGIRTIRKRLSGGVA